jgi:hypothetical protein
MSAEDIVTLLADENGNLNLDEAHDALSQRAVQLQEDGARLGVVEMLNVLENQIGAIAATLVETVLLTQKSVIAAHSAINYLMTGEQTDPDFDIEEQRHLMLLSFELDKMSQVVDILEATVERKE